MNFIPADVTRIWDLSWQIHAKTEELYRFIVLIEMHFQIHQNPGVTLMKSNMLAAGQ